MAAIINCEDKFSKALKEHGIDKLEVYQKVYQDYCKDRDKPIPIDIFGKQLMFYYHLTEAVAKSVCKSFDLNYQDYQSVIDVMNNQRRTNWEEMKDLEKKLTDKLEADYMSKMIKFSQEADNKEVPNNRKRNSAKSKNDKDIFESLAKMSEKINNNDDANKAMEELFGKN